MQQVLDFQAQPWSATDLAAFVFAVLAALYATLWVRDREAGMPWFCGGFALLAAFYALNRHLLPTGPGINPMASSLVWAALGSILVGMLRYLDAPAPMRRWLLGCAIVPYLGVMAAHAAGMPVLRPYAQLPVLAVALLASLLALWAARREPGAGHGYVAAVLFTVPVFVLTMMLRGADAFLVRYHAVPPLLLLGLTLLTVSLLRRRRSLEAEVRRRAEAEAAWIELNAALEARVAERTADLRRMVEGLETFNRNVAHDLNGLLGGIAGVARVADEALRQDADGAAVAARVLPLIVTQAEVSTQLVTALMSLARVGEGVIACESVDLDVLVRDIVAQQLLALPAGAAKPQIDIQMLPVVHADPGLLRPVLQNLIGNALKFSRGHAQPHIEISARTVGGAVTVSISDNGVGFDMATARTLFQPFTRLHGDDYEGHGVGLSIVRRAVERHGGRVWADSQPGRGAAFWFTLPQGVSN